MRPFMIVAVIGGVTLLGPDALDDLVSNSTLARRCHVVFEPAAMAGREEAYMTVSNEGGACIWSSGVEDDGKGHILNRFLRTAPGHGKAFVGEVGRSRSYQVYIPNKGYVGQDTFVEVVARRRREIVHHIRVEQADP